jgi:dephospho-CoA kinase
MKLIGIVGGVASGKSLVARALAELGAGALDADRAGHEVLRTPEIEEAVRRRWGAGVFGPDGHVDRSRLAETVFADSPAASEERKHLEQLLHPEIARRLVREAERLAANGCPAAVLDAPLLTEAGWNRYCDWLIFVDAPRLLRLARARARGWSETDFAAREGVQESLDSKRKLADVVIDNSGSPEETRAQVEQFWRSHIG